MNGDDLTSEKTVSRVKQLVTCVWKVFEIRVFSEGFLRTTLSCQLANLEIFLGVKLDND